MIPWIFIAVGLFDIVCVVILNLGMNTRRAQRMVRFIGVAGAKIVYTVIGIALLTTGIAAVMGWITLN